MQHTRPVSVRRPIAGRAASALIALLFIASTAAAQPGEHAWGLTATNTLVRFHTSAPGTMLATRPITGLPPGEEIVAIEVLERSGTFVGISKTGRLYTIDRQTGAATAANPAAPPVALTGTAFGVTDYADSPMMISDANEEVFVSASGAIVASFTHSGDIVALARKRNPHSESNAAFLALDAANDALYVRALDNPALTLIGPLGVDTSAAAGFDISHPDQTGYAALTVGGTPRLYTVNLDTGAATLVGTIAFAPLISLALDLQGIPDVGPHTTTEANEDVTFTIARRGDTSVAADYRVHTDPGANLFATAGVDYVHTDHVVTFAAGETVKAITIRLLDDLVLDGTKEIRATVGWNRPNAAYALASVIVLDNEGQAPAITVLSPSSPATLTSGAVTIYGTVTDNDVPGVRLVAFNDTIDAARQQDSTTGSPWVLTVPLVAGANQIRIVATDVDSRTDTETLTVTANALGMQMFTFAEGSTGDFFDTNLAIANFGPAPSAVNISFLRQDGSVVIHSVTAPGNRRSTVNVDELAGVEATATASIMNADGFPLAVERTMRWGVGR